MTAQDTATPETAATAASTPPGDVPAWWRQAVVYQVYPRSFADADGDGLGDLVGITDRADYLADLGVDAVWLSPFYPSALADGGYDVADYRDVDPRLGTLDDFDAMVAALHARGIKVVVDIVPNHTSDQHAWFQAALAAGRGSPERARYLFREGSGPDGAEPPTDWESSFGGPAWRRVEDGQWYLHSFAPEQPDLAWDHPEVRADFVRTLRFWSDRGVDGFRIDVAHMLTKDLTEPLPSAAEIAALPRDGNHPLYDRDDVHEVYAEWREVFDSYDPPRAAVAEAWVDAERVPLYARPESLGQSFNFDLLLAEPAAADFRRIITDNLALAARSGSSSTWVLSNHDVVRHPTRYGVASRGDGLAPRERAARWLVEGGPEADLDRERGLRVARAATLLVLGLPGSTYLYQGEELGLHEVADIPADQRQDPTFSRTDGAQVGRDGCRVPIPWTPDGTAFGFGTGGAHLPQPAWFAEHAASTQEDDPDTTLGLYRRALAARRTLQGAERLDWVDTRAPDVLHYVRPGGWHVVTNFGAEPYPLDVPDGARLVLASVPEAETQGGTVVPPLATAWFATGA
ncbi:glycoside hydrolase family 13 protein [Cellulomonas triticagri]|uniref:Glycoside hydrolase family 13 protein n=1 Tax=Cellulomonas triticagri TaxID=2483352 RepID=A0A3M2JSG3_9CELL|nr:alpha-amylase family glycosyl hydrolase [Cellulomonas triticagri]RMI13675.1 glycoside hydrolase family 13 protein [Cellulomonas triticagri]